MIAKISKRFTTEDSESAEEGKRKVPPSYSRTDDYVRSFNGHRDDARVL